MYYTVLRVREYLHTQEDGPSKGKARNVGV